MRALDLPPPLARTFLGALLAIARADGVVNPEELDVLHRVAHTLGVSLDPEDLLFADAVVPAALADALAGLHHDPYRAPTAASPAEVRAAFIAAAEDIALADRDVDHREEALIHAFRVQLGLAAEAGAPDDETLDVEDEVV